MAGENSKMWMAVAIAAMVVAVALGGYIIISNDEDDSQKWHLGKYDLFEVSGNDGTYDYEGTMKAENIRVDGIMVTIKWTYDIWMTNGEPYIVTMITETVDMTINDLGVLQGSETITTAWGEKTVDVYLHATDGIQTHSYIDPKNEFLCYMLTVYYGGDDTIVYKLKESGYI